MTPAEELRKAARRIRMADAGATPGPWKWTENRSVKAPTRRVVASVTADELWPMHEDARHIAMWHPGITELVADLLDDVGTEQDAAIEVWHAKALKLARAINDPKVSGQ